LLIRQRRIAEPQFVEGRPLVAQDVTDRHAHAADQVGQFRPRRWRLQVLDDTRFDAGLANEGQGIARSSAAGIVIDDDVHEMFYRQQFSVS
jgi:hypothetical protein